MKRIFLFLLIISPSISIAQLHFIIKGNIKNLNNECKIFLFRGSSNTIKWDSAITKSGKFEFSGNFRDTAIATIYVDHKGGGLDDIRIKHDFIDQKSVYLVNGTTFINGDDSLKNAKLSGNNLNEEYYKYCSLFEVKPTNGFLALNIKFLEENPDSYVSLDLAYKYINAHFSSPASSATVFAKLSRRLRETKEGIEFQNFITNTHDVMLGMQAPEFALEDLKGNIVKLSNFRGKYLLLDFWASWCKPCRLQNPELVKIFNHFKQKKFTIIGITFDKIAQKKAWKSAIKSDGLSWPQLADFEAQRISIGKLYSIDVIPQNFLIDPNGKIIAKNLRGDDLENKLSEIFGKI